MKELYRKRYNGFESLFKQGNKLFYEIYKVGHGNHVQSGMGGSCFQSPTGLAYPRIKIIKNSGDI